MAMKVEFLALTLMLIFLNPMENQIELSISLPFLFNQLLRAIDACEFFFQCCRQRSRQCIADYGLYRASSNLVAC